MIICSCKAINDKLIKQAIEQGYVSIKQIQDQIGACTDCKICAATIKQLIKDHKTCQK